VSPKPETPRPSLVEAIRGASFELARRGYDRQQVDEFLERLAARVEGNERAWDPETVKRELEQVGESTTSILTSAEEAARTLRADAARDAEQIHREASAEAEKLKREADEAASAALETAEDEGRNVRLQASRKAEETVAGAEARAEELIDEALRQRRVVEARIERLLERRDAALAELEQVVGELSTPTVGPDASDSERTVELPSGAGPQPGE